MTEEAKQFLGDLVWNNKDFMQAFTANYSFVNSGLAAIYKVSPPVRDFDRVEFPVADERSGLLGSGSLSHSDEQARRYGADGPRLVCPRAVSVPARTAASARCRHEPAAGARIAARHQSRAHGHARDQ